MAAALSGMFFWGLLIVRPWQWLQTKFWGITALFGSLIGLLEIICTSWLMWVFYVLFLLFILPPSSDIIHHLPAHFLLAILGLGIFTLIVVSTGSKGVIFLVGIGAGIFFALLARRIFH
jgi:hypothetical protein